MPTDKNLYLSFGPYVVSAAKKDQYITLTPNPDYNWGPQPHLDEDHRPLHPGPHRSGAGPAERRSPDHLWPGDR